jgi:cystathionine beta-lyase/cystathionine gamma-synthase
VKRVYHPGLGNELPGGLLGTSSLLSFEVDDAVDIPRFCDALELFKLGVSWGGHESLVVPAIVTLQQNAGPNSAIDFGVPATMVRLHVGLEGTEALAADIERAFHQAVGG